MFKFNTENIFTGYIKNLLVSFNLPQCLIFNSTSECTKYLDDIKTQNLSLICIIKKFKDNRDCLVNVVKDTIVRFKFIDYYIFNYPYLNITKTFNNTTNIYDSKTHEYLGNFLTFIKEIKGINLLSLYNYYNPACFEDKDYKYLKIKINWNNTYMIALNCNKEVKSVLTTIQDKDEIMQILNTDKEGNNFETINLGNITFSNPKILNIRFPRTEEEIYKEKDLYLYIRLPLRNKSVVNILKGNYQNSANNIHANNEKNDNINYDNVDLNNLISNISLLDTSWKYKKTSVPFVDRLIEYLTGNVITENDLISNNILKSKENYYNKYTYKKILNMYSIPKKDILNEKYTLNNKDKINIQESIYTNKLVNIDNKDLLFNIDKDIEYVLTDERYPEALIQELNNKERR